jgi:hypothetical protein
MTIKEMEKLTDKELYHIMWEATQRQCSVCMVDGEVIDELYEKNLDYIEEQGEIILTAHNILMKRAEQRAKN